jgi:hypothetical protein
MSCICSLPGGQVPMYKVERLEVFHAGRDLGRHVDQTAITEIIKFRALEVNMAIDYSLVSMGFYSFLEHMKRLRSQKKCLVS